MMTTTHDELALPWHQSQAVLKKNPVLIGSHLLVSSYRHDPSPDSIHGHNYSLVVVINIYLAVTLRQAFGIRNKK